MPDRRATPTTSSSNDAAARAAAGIRLASLVRRRRASAERFDRFYRLYVSALIGGFIIYTVLRADAASTSAELTANVDRWGGDVLTLVLAVVWALALRAGARGAPLAIEAAEIHHVLLAPIDLKHYLRGHLVRLLRATLGAALVIALLFGEVASRHLAGSHLGWIMAATSLWTALIPVSMLLSVLANAVGRRSAAAGTGAALVVLAVVDVATPVPLSPSGIVARHSMQPAVTAPLGWIVWPGAFALALAAWCVVDRVSLPGAERRSRLVAQLRFAMAQQDIRSLMLIRRQMAAEEPLDRPRITIQGLRQWPTLRRNLHGQVRWPGAQLLRMALLAAVSTVAIVVTIGTELWALPLAGIANYLFALETVEPFVQEFDHPMILELAPVRRRGVSAQHLIGAALPLCVVMLLASGVVSIMHGAAAALIAASLAPVAAIAAATAAALSVRPLPADGAMELPEMTAPKVVLRLGLPPAAATVGLLGLSRLRAAGTVGEAVDLAGSLTVVSVLVTTVAAAWLILRDEVTATAGSTATTTPAGSHT